MFTPEDVERLKQIYHLVKERGMTLKGANKVLKRAKSDSVAQEMELLERLQKIRAALVEVREELKAGDGEQVVEENYPQEEAQSEPEPKVEEPAVEAVKPAETPIEEPAVGAEQTEQTEQAEQPAAEQPKKRVVRRRKKSDEEDKELFPFYEQSLF